MSFFVTKADGAYSLTTAGYVAVAVILVALIVVAALFAKREKKEKKKIGTKQLVVCAMAVALAMVTSMLKIYSFPFGGSVTLFSMLFICFVGYLYGPATGMLTGAAYGVLQLLIEPYIYFPLQVLVDYPLAFGALGLSGVFAESKGTRTFRMFQQIQTWSCKRILVWRSCKICICGNFRMALFWRICVGRLGGASIFACI